MHKSVLLEESLSYLNIQEDSVIVDATLGYGGHSSAILKRVKRGYLFAFDQDQEAVAYSQMRLDAIASNFCIIHDNFCNLQERLGEYDVYEVDGFLFDLGVSSPQLDEEERGFSFHHDAKLDMRMDQTQTFSAYELVNHYSFEDLTQVIRKYGEERYAASIARGIVHARSKKDIETTLELVEIIKAHVPEKYRRTHHPARKVFQALRIEVNRELEVLEQGLEQAMKMVKVGGRICVITFHSLEDRLVKNMMKNASYVDPVFRVLPAVPEEYLPNFRIIANVAPTAEEMKENRRARSARLRVIERVK